MRKSLFKYYNIYSENKGVVYLHSKPKNENYRVYFEKLEINVEEWCKVQYL